MRDFKISDRIGYFVADNASNNDSALRQIAKDIFCLPDRNHASVAVRVCVDRVGLGRVERVQHVLADYAFDAVGADEDGCVGGSCIGEGQSDI